MRFRLNLEYFSSNLVDARRASDVRILSQENSRVLRTHSLFERLKILAPTGGKLTDGREGGLKRPKSC